VIEALHNGKIVTIVEKRDTIGVTTMLSGGNTRWVPRDHKLGTGDLEADYSEEEAFEYLRATDVCNDSTDKRKLDYIRPAPRVIERVEKARGYQFLANSGKGDYYLRLLVGGYRFQGSRTNCASRPAP